MFAEQWRLRSLTFQLLLYWTGPVTPSISLFLAHLACEEAAPTPTPTPAPTTRSRKFTAVWHKRLQQGVRFFSADEPTVLLGLSHQSTPITD